MTAVVGACAPANAPTAAPADTAASEPEPEDSFTARHAALDRRIAVQQRIASKTEGETRARALFAMAEAYSEHLALASEQHYTHALQQLDSSDIEMQEEWARTNETFTAQRHRWLDQAEQSYDRALESPGLPNELMAEARYGRATTRQAQGDDEGAHRDYEALLRNHPHHALVGPSALVLADAAFADNEVRNAEPLYLLASGRGELGSQLYARYRLGWIAFNRHDNQAALDRWVDVVIHARTLEHSAGLADSAAKDCVRAYAEIGRPEAASAFFQRLHPARSLELLQILAEHYRAEGRFADAERVGIPLPPAPR